MTASIRPPDETPGAGPTVGIIMGSSSDAATMAPAAEVLTQFGVTHEVRVISAHRSPHRMVDYATQATARGMSVIIAGAGGAAHLPGMVASMTTLPVIGVPVPSKHLSGEDSLLSIVSMPGGVPVATMAIGGAENAALMAIRMLALCDPRLVEALDEHAQALEAKAIAQDALLNDGRLNDDSKEPLT